MRKAVQPSPPGESAARPYRSRGARRAAGGTGRTRSPAPGRRGAARFPRCAAPSPARAAAAARAQAARASFLAAEKVPQLVGTLGRNAPGLERQRQGAQRQQAIELTRARLEPLERRQMALDVLDIAARDGS